MPCFKIRFAVFWVMVAAVSADSSNLASPNLITAPTEQQGQGKATKGPIFALDVSAIREREAAVKDMGKYTTQGVSFDCSGMQCGATLYLPKSTLLTTKLSRAYINAKQGSKASSSKLPAVIVMAHGLGGERVWLDKFAGTFADAGYAVFTFDYRHWGSSDGQPRQWISINKQHADWFDAIKHVQSHLNSVVDPQRLVLWGTSFAGGHVIVVASKLPGQVTAVISNVPHLDGAKATQTNRALRGPRANAKLAMAALADLASETAGNPVYVPLAGRIGSTAVMQLTEHDMTIYSAAHPQTEAQWQNLTRARFATEQAFSQYSPINFVDKVACPLLIIAGKKDGLCPYSAAVAAAAKAPRATLVSLDVGHFDPYVQPTLGQSLQEQLRFLKKYVAQA